MIGYSDHGVGYLDPDRHDPQILYMIAEEKEEEEKKKNIKRTGWKMLVFSYMLLLINY